MWHLYMHIVLLSSAGFVRMPSSLFIFCVSSFKLLTIMLGDLLSATLSRNRISVLLEICHSQHLILRLCLVPARLKVYLTFSELCFIAYALCRHADVTVGNYIVATVI